MINLPLIIIGKTIGVISKVLNLGSGSTWPGHIALSINKNFIKDILKKNQKLKIILIAGTNGKTTTGKLIRTIIEHNKKSLSARWRVFQNEGGANLLNGIASSIVLHSDILCALNYDFAIFEIDENTLPLILKELTPDYIILLNLFRDQLDRYGEVNTIAKKWGDAMRHLLPKTTLILNADDPQIARLGLHLEGVSVRFFGLNDKKLASEKIQYTTDSTYCLDCNSKLEYSLIFYSHLGDWKCPNCGNARPKLDRDAVPFYPLVGIYNHYNTIAAVLLTEMIGVNKKIIGSALQKFKPAFGRQEILNINGKKVQIFLSKNPTSFNESLKTITNLNAKNVLLVLNDRIPDGRDVSWIWDVDFEEFISNFRSITISGDRAYDMGLRIKYTSENQKSMKQFNNSTIESDFKKAIMSALEHTVKTETLYILPTYSAMLEVRKILTGKKIL